MANDKVKFKIEIETDDKGVKVATADVEELKDSIKEAEKGSGELSTSLANFAHLTQVIDAVTSAFGQLNGIVGDLSGAYKVQEVAEAKLAQVMSNTMGASEDEVQAIKDLCAAQQQLGVIGDEVQIAGAQELGTYLEKTATLKKLIPVMNDMVAQQYGLDASQEAAVGIATMLGKVMEGQVGALSRYGYSFDETQAKILKFGTEEQKAAVLAQVVGDAVGGMNERLAQTSSGQMQQLTNSLGDLKEYFGSIAVNIEPMVAGIASVGDSVGSIMKLGEAFSALKNTTLGQKVATLALAAAQKTVAIATKAWEAVQIALNAVLSANPIALTVLAIGALVAALKYAYDNCEEFRVICDKVFAVIKNIASIIFSRLIAAFKQACKWIKQAWNWLKEFLGLDGEVVEVKVEATDDSNVDLTLPEGVGETKKASKQMSDANSMKGMQERMNAIQAKIDLEVDPAKRAELYNELKEIENTKLQIEAKMKLDADGYTGAMADMTKSTDALTDALGGLSKGDSLSDMTKRHNKSLKAVTKQNDKYRDSLGKVADSSVTDNVMQTASAFDSLGQSIGGSAGQMVSWAAQNVAAMTQVIAQIVTMIAAKEAESVAGATASGSSMPFPANIAAIAAGVAAVIASFAKMPKFAAGGIISGPTIGLMGEYSGASNNPEVVAPLNRLKSLLGDVGGGVGGRVEFDIKGRKLVGVLARENSFRYRQ